MFFVRVNRSRPNVFEPYYTFVHTVSEFSRSSKQYFTVEGEGNIVLKSSNSRKHSTVLQQKQLTWYSTAAEARTNTVLQQKQEK